MENASKALIIAGAVLIAIILIGFGVKVLLTAKNSPDQVDQASTSLSTSMFNSQFEPYFTHGSYTASAKQVRALISKVIVNDTQDSNRKVMVYFKFHDGSYITTHTTLYPILDRLQAMNNSILDSKMYLIDVNTNCDYCTGGYDNGYIACIRVFEQ